MSNTAIEFLGFMDREKEDAQISHELSLVDGAQPGEAANAWTSPDAAVWSVADQRLHDSGITPQQVEVIWLKEADAFPRTGFEPYIHGLAVELTSIIHNAALRYPNLHQVFVSPRTYGGYGPGGPNPEPYAYETGFAVKLVVSQWVSAPAKRPWVGWGPYLWTDGTAGRSDGLKWECADVSDGTHPSKLGVAKVSDMLASFFRASPFAPWFRVASPPASKPAQEPNPALSGAPESPVISWWVLLAGVVALGVGLFAGVYRFRRAR